MTPERWREITDVFHAALSHDAATREGFLNEACKHDPSLRAEVDALVAAHHEAGSFGERPLAIPEDIKRLEPGTQLGPFRIESLLGVGGMGEVYRATDTQLGRAVAIKVLPDSVARDPDRVARLTREARVLAALNHPHIAAIYGIEEADDLRALVLELVDGKTLAESFRGRAVPIGDALAIAGQIAEALEAAHEKGIVHRDLKPANIALTREGLVKVLDFGLAKAVETADSDRLHTMGSERTREGAVVGTAAYMSPEQARGLAVDKRTDIWAFGCVLYEMLTGRQAFSGTTITDTLAAVIEREPDWSALPVSTPPRVRRVLRRALQKNPALRLRDIGDARIELVAGEEDAPVDTRRTSSRWALAAALASLIGMVGVGMFLLGRQGETVAEGVGANPNAPAFRQLTFRRGAISMARFAADGRNIIYSASWDGRPHELYAGSLDGPESRPLDWPAGVLFAVSRTNEVALSLGCQRDPVANGCAGALATAPLTGGAPRALATDISFADWGPNGELAVVRPHGRIKRLEFPQGRVVHEAEGLVFPRVSPQGRYIAVVSAEDPATAVSGRGVVSILVIDRNGTKRTLATGWQLASGLAWSPSGSEVWFSGMQNGIVTLHAVTLDGQQRTVLHIPGTLRLHDIGPDGSVLFAMLTTRNVTMIKRPEQETEQPFSWFDEGWAVGLSPDGRLLLFNERGRAVGVKPTMYLRPTDGKSPPVRLGEGAALGLSRDARWVLAIQPVTGQQWQLAVIPTGPGDSIVLPRGAIESYHESYASFSPDGRRVVFNGRRSGEGLRAFVQDLPTGEPRPITPDLAYNGLNEISPDGQWVAESTNSPTGVRHHLYPLSGSGPPRPIPGAGPELTPMQWTPDGSEIFMRTWTPTTSELETKAFRLSIRTGARTLWRTIRPADLAGAGFPRGVMITPDGRTYAYNYVQMLQDLYVATGLK